MKADAYSEPSQTSKMELFANIVNGLQLLLKIFAERSIFDIYGFCEYAPERTLIIIVSHLEAFITVFMTLQETFKTFLRHCKLHESNQDSIIFL